MKNNDPKFKYFQKLILQHLSTLDDDLSEKEIAKAFDVADVMMMRKGRGLPVGTIREWKGKKYIKISPNKWRPKYDSNTRGAKMAVAAIKRKAQNCTNSQELMNLILENRDRFSDENGRPLPFVQELSDYISKTNDLLERRNSVPEEYRKYLKTKVDDDEEEEDSLEKEKADYKKTHEENIDNYVKSMKLGAWKDRVYINGILPNGSDQKIYIEKTPEDYPFKEKWVLKNKKGSSVYDFAGDAIDDVKEALIKKFPQIEKYSVDEIIEAINNKETDKLKKAPEEKTESSGKSEFDKFKELINNFPEDKRKEKLEIAAKRGGKRAEFAKQMLAEMEGDKKEPEKTAENLEDKTKEELAELYRNSSSLDEKNKIKEELGRRKKEDEKKKQAERDKQLDAKRKKYGELDLNYRKDRLGNKIYEATKDGRKYIIENGRPAIYSVGSDGSEDLVYDGYYDMKDKTMADKKVYLTDRWLDTKPDMTPEEIEESEQEKHDNRSNAMRGNQNAKKDGVAEDETKERTKKIEEKKDFINNYLKELEGRTDWKYGGSETIKRLGEKKLQEWASKEYSITDFTDKLADKIVNIEEERGEPVGELSIQNAIWSYKAKMYATELAKKKLEQLHQEAEAKEEDIPVSSKDMDEAKSVIGRDVSAILNGQDTFGNRKQGLVDKIKRRIRNEPALARAMLVYIQQQQKETGKTVFTPRNSIWKELPKLNENAKNAILNDETENKTGVSDNLYESDDGGITVVENKDWGRYQISFPGKPDSDTISTLKRNGFRWSPKTKTWVAYNSANGEYGLKRVAESLGLKKPNKKKDSENGVETEKQGTKKGIKDIRESYQSKKSVTGNKKTVTLPSGEKIKCHYKLVEADAPTASHDEQTYAPTEGFPTTSDGKSVNDRDYQNDKDAQESVRKIANKFNSLALDNPPIVTKDGIVVSGNNRTMSSKLAAKNGTDKEYLDSLKDQIDEYGLEEEDLKDYKNPRLILEIDNEHEGDYTTEEFAKYNQNDKKTMNNVEKAVKLTKTLNTEKVKSIAESLADYDTMGELYQDRKGSQLFVQKLVNAGIIGENEKAQYLTSDGMLNDTGKDFTETVLVGSVLNENNIRKLDTPGGKRIRQKLVRAILPLIENKGTGKEYSFNKELNEAVDIAVNVMKNHDKFPTVKDYLDQGTLFDEKKPDAATSKLAELIHDEGEKAFAQRMKDLGAGLQISANGEQDIFLDGVESKDSLMKRFLGIEKALKNKAYGALENFRKLVKSLTR